MKYPQPPFKNFVKTESGYIIPLSWRHVEPVKLKRNGAANPKYGWEISWDATICNAEGKPCGFASMCDVIVATADTKEELL